MLLAGGLTLFIDMMAVAMPARLVTIATLCASEVLWTKGGNLRAERVLCVPTDVEHTSPHSKRSAALGWFSTFWAQRWMCRRR